MEQPNNEQDKKKVNEDLVVFMRKRSDHEVPRYTARLKTYVDIQRKRRRAATARRNSEHSYNDNKGTSPSSGLRKKSDDQKDKADNRYMGLTAMESADPGQQLNMFSGKQMSEHPGSEDGGRTSGRKSKPRHRRAKPQDVSSVRLCSIMTSSSDSVDMSSIKTRRGGGEEKVTRGRSISRSRSDADDPSDRCCRRRRRRSCRRRRRRCSRRRRRRSCRRRRRRCSRRRRRRRC